MKRVFVMASCAFFLLSVSSCTKTNNVIAPTLHPIVGLWIGTLTADNEPEAGELYYAFDIRSDSSILVTSQGADGYTYYNAGNWTLKDSLFSAQIVNTNGSQRGSEESLTAIYDTSGLLKAGIWSNIHVTAKGTFELRRID